MFGCTKRQNGKLFQFHERWQNRSKMRVDENTTSGLLFLCILIITNHAGNTGNESNSHTHLKKGKEESKRAPRLPELRAQRWWKDAVLAEPRAAIRALTGSTVTHAGASGRGTCSLRSTLSVFQAWKAHLMGRGGCKQNSRRPAASQRSLPAQGEAFMAPPLTPSSPTLSQLHVFCPPVPEMREQLSAPSVFACPWKSSWSGAASLEVWCAAQRFY